MIKQIQGGNTKQRTAEIFFDNEQSIEGYNNSIQPVVDVMKIKSNVFKNRNSGGDFFTTPTDKDFYLTGYEVSIANVAAAEASKEGYTTIVLENGETQKIGHVIAVTNATNAVYCNVANKIYPLKLKRGSVLTLINGATYIRGMVCGYTEETSTKIKLA
jgi:hypothetical protein